MVKCRWDFNVVCPIPNGRKGLILKLHFFVRQSDFFFPCANAILWMPTSLKFFLLPFSGIIFQCAGIDFSLKSFHSCLFAGFFEGQVWIFNFGKNPRRSHSTWSLVDQVVTLDGGDESNVHCTYIRIQIQRRQNTWMLGTWSLVSIMLSQFVAQPRDLMFTKFQP